MAFRRDKARFRAWQIWLAKHHNVLIEIGLPDWIYSEERRWICFLQEGGDLETRWGVDMLSLQQAKQFREFIITEYGSEQHKCMLRELQQRIESLDDDA
jgi:hypothetical protein